MDKKHMIVDTHVHIVSDDRREISAILRRGTGRGCAVGARYGTT